MSPGQRPTAACDLTGPGRHHSRLGRQSFDALTTTEREEIKALKKEVAELKRANEILKAARFSRPRSSTADSGWRCSGSARPAVFVPIAPHVYAAKKRQAFVDERLLEVIHRVHRENFGVYGVRKVWHALQHESIRWA